MEDLQIGELVALAFNSGIVLAAVQLLKLTLLPRLRASAPWAIPLIASAIGLA
ncbi:hypothetical protein LCGC14_3047120, partial [marine sediment metagenome]